LRFGGAKVQLVGEQGFAVEVALSERAPPREQGARLRRGLDPLGHDLQAERAPETGRGQQIQGGETGPEVVQRDVDTQRGQVDQGALSGALALEGRGLGDLQHQRFWWEPACGQDALQSLEVP